MYIASRGDLHGHVYFAGDHGGGWMDPEGINGYVRWLDVAKKIQLILVRGPGLMDGRTFI